jgi:hypothetical protein
LTFNNATGIYAQSFIYVSLKKQTSFDWKSSNFPFELEELVPVSEDELCKKQPRY